MEEANGEGSISFIFKKTSEAAFSSKKFFCLLTEVVFF
jgi:hypothetical protein